MEGKKINARFVWCDLGLIRKPGVVVSRLTFQLHSFHRVGWPPIAVTREPITSYTCFELESGAHATCHCSLCSSTLAVGTKTDENVVPVVADARDDILTGTVLDASRESVVATWLRARPPNSAPGMYEAAL